MTTEAVTKGYFYVVQLAPDVAPGRIKLGWSVSPSKRLTQHRCAAPTAVHVGTWACHRDWEPVAIRAITVGLVPISGEVFDTDDIAMVVRRAAAFFDVTDTSSSRRPAYVAEGPPNDPMTVSEAAERLRINPETVRVWLRSGKLRGHMPGGDKIGYRIPATEVERVLRGNTDRAEASAA